MQETRTNLSLDKLEEGALAEIREGKRTRSFCDTICLRAMEEMKSRRRERPFSRLFYELAFFRGEERCLAAAYEVWMPVMRSWILHWNYELAAKQMDDVVDDLIYSTFDAMLKAVRGNRFTDFEAGKVHNFFKRTLHIKVFGLFRRRKRAILSNLNKRKELLEEYHLKILEDEILPRFESERSTVETILFRRHLLKGVPIFDLASETKVVNEITGTDNPLKALHNRKQTMMWNVYRLLKWKDSSSESRKYKEIMNLWTGEIYTGTTGFDSVHYKSAME